MQHHLEPVWSNWESEQKKLCMCSDSLDVLFLFSRCSTFAQNACCSHVGWLPVRTDASLLIARWDNFPHDSMKVFLFVSLLLLSHDVNPCTDLTTTTTWQHNPHMKTISVISKLHEKLILLMCKNKARDCRTKAFQLDASADISTS